MIFVSSSYFPKSLGLFLVLFYSCFSFADYDASRPNDVHDVTCMTEKGLTGSGDSDLHCIGISKAWLSNTEFGNVYSDTWSEYNYVTQYGSRSYNHNGYIAICHWTPFCRL